MATRKRWTVYKIGSSPSGPVAEIEAFSMKTALDHAAARFGVARDKLYAVGSGLTSKKKAKRHVFVEWSEGGKYQGGSYEEDYVPQLLDILRARNVASASIEEEEVTL